MAILPISRSSYEASESPFTDITIRHDTMRCSMMNRGLSAFHLPFKQGDIHGIEFFKTCMNALQLKKRPYHIMFMPCSNWIKYGQRFKRLDWYIGKHRQDLTSGLYDVDICDARESLHEAKGGEKRILERNYLITGKIKGKEIIIIDDVLTTGQSVVDYKEEIERCGGKVVAAIFYGKTLSMPSMLLVQIHVWGNHIAILLNG